MWQKIKTTDPVDLFFDVMRVVLAVAFGSLTWVVIWG